MTQSAVSHQLRDIEARLGTPLFLRVGKRMIPTAAGERVLRSAKPVVEGVEQIETDVRRLAGQGSDVLRLCAECHTGYHWLPPLLQVFERRHPRVEVRIAVECTPRPIESLLEGSLDLALITQTIRDPRVRVHLYGKGLRAGREVGHVNAYGDDLDDVLARARHAAAWFAGELGDESE